MTTRGDAWALPLRDALALSGVPFGTSFASLRIRGKAPDKFGASVHMLLQFENDNAWFFQKPEGNAWMLTLRA